VSQAYQTPLGIDFLKTSKTESTKSSDFLDLPEDGLDDLLALGVSATTSHRPQFSRHPFLDGCVLRNSSTRVYWRCLAVFLFSRCYVCVDAIALKGSNISFAEIP